MTEHNENIFINSLRDLTQDNSLPSFAWPGGYPLFYLDSDINILCPKCANRNDEFTCMLIDAEINWEDNSLFCDHCSSRIESAYAD